MNMHVHDLETYLNTPVPHTFTHHVHHLRFGPQIPDSISKKLSLSSSQPWTSHHLNPLEDTEQSTDDAAYNFMYFVKVVSTSYLPLGWERTLAKQDKRDIPHEFIDLGSYGHEHDGSLETHQYSVTSHKRSLLGGDDSQEGHAERLHARGGIPGVFFSYVCHPFTLWHSS